MVNPIIGTKRLTKVLMDRGSGLNIMYAETLDAIMLGKQVVPLGQIDLPIIFGDPTNYRMETLTFKVVGFHGTYHAILGHPCYVKVHGRP